MTTYHLLANGVVVSPFASVWIDNTPIQKTEPVRQEPDGDKFRLAEKSDGVFWFDFHGNLIIPSAQATVDVWPRCCNRLGLLVAPRERLSPDERDGLLVSQKETSTQDTSSDGVWIMTVFSRNPLSPRSRFARLPFGLPSRVPDPRQSLARQNRRMRKRIKAIRHAWRAFLRAMVKAMVTTSSAQTQTGKAIALRLAKKEVARRLKPRNKWVLRQIPLDKSGEQIDVASRVRKQSDDLLMSRVSKALGDDARQLLTIGVPRDLIALETGIPLRTLERRLSDLRRSLARDYMPGRIPAMIH